MDIFFDWVWERHHNILSWYIRPLFLLPYCYFSFYRNVKGIVVTLLLFPTSLFWFPKPENPSEKVIQYLAWEYDFITQGDVLEQYVLAILVIVFLYLLALAFWRRSLLYGLLVLNIGTCLKIMWSIYFADSVGYAAILPSVITLAICNGAGFAFYYHYKKLDEKN